MLKYIIALFLFLPAQVWGGVFVGFGQNSCAGETQLVSNAVSTQSFDDINVLGQSFTLAATKTVYAIKLNGSGSSGVITFRIGSSSNLGTYLAEVTGVSMSNSGQTTITLSSPLSMAAGTYYFAISKTGGTINLLWNNPSSYAGGTVYYNGTPGTWTLNDYENRDLWFEVLGCD